MSSYYDDFEAPYDLYEKWTKGAKRFYSPVGNGVSLLRAQGSVSYVQSDEETYDMTAEWIDRLAKQYGARQQAALRGDSKLYMSADRWLKMIADEHWHEIIKALKRPPLSEEQPHGTTVKP